MTQQGSQSNPQKALSGEQLEGAVEKIGLIPRSILRTFNRFKQQLFPEAIEFFIQEFRVSRSQVLVSLQCLLTLIIIPLFINFCAKTFFLTPFIEYRWNTYKTDIFLNTYQQEQALAEMRNFEEVLYFDLLTHSKEREVLEKRDSKSQSDKISLMSQIIDTTNQTALQPGINETRLNQGSSLDDTTSIFLHNSRPIAVNLSEPTSEFSVTIQKKLIDLAQAANKQSIAALTNLFADFLTLLSLLVLFVLLKPQIIILKSFLIETFYSLNDTTKSFMLIFSTDLLVGFHSPRGWEIVLDVLLSRFGLPHDENIILLFVATFPVLLDSVIKYWIFRYLNKISPSTVATYHAMIE